MENKEVIEDYSDPNEKMLDGMLEDYHDFDPNDNTTWVESKQYWKSILSEESNKDPEVHRKFCKLHEKLVNTVIEFCRENNLETVDSIEFYADGLTGSYGYGEWTCGTDSSCSMRRITKNDKGHFRLEEEPFLNNI